jgi:hypothetical protein
VREEKWVRFHLVALLKKKKKKKREDPFELKLTFSNPRIWRRARHKPTSIAGG